MHCALAFELMKAGSTGSEKGSALRDLGETFWPDPERTESRLIYPKLQAGARSDAQFGHRAEIQLLE